MSPLTSLSLIVQHLALLQPPPHQQAFPSSPPCQVATNSTCNNINTRQMVLPCTTSITTGFGEKPILSFETRSRIAFFQSRASRREQDFVHRISSLETRSRILFTESQALRRDREFCSSNLEIRDEVEIFQSFYQNIFLSQKKRCFP